ncbi:MAG: hypothetical protein NTW29_09145 [Bacteroidetes bacterium]|nr:hypothetical protein [Bacteroidota bacterium]
MKVFLLIFIAAYACSCGKTSAVEKKLSAADSLIITFTLPDKDTVINTVTTTEPVAIKKLTGFLGGKTNDGVPCGYDGHIDFFSKQQLLLQVVFSYHKEDCRQFIFDFENKVQSVEVSNEAKNFLQSLASGKNWY